MVLRKSKIKRKDNIVGWLFCSPIIISFLLFALIPLVLSIVIAFSNWKGLSGFSTIKINGFENFATLFTGHKKADFWKALFNTFFYSVIDIPIIMGLSLILAVILNKIPLKGAFRIIFYIPSIANIVAIAYIWNVLFKDNEQGLINRIFGKVFNMDPVAWHNKEAASRTMLIMLFIWKSLGYTIIMYLAGLQNISSSYYEAAKIDGAGPVRSFISITAPLIGPMTFYLVVTSCMGWLQMYNEPQFLLGGEGPGGSGLTMMTLIMSQYNNRQFGTMSALAWVLALIIIAVTAVNFMYNKWRQKDTV